MRSGKEPNSPWERHDGQWCLVEVWGCGGPWHKGSWTWVVPSREPGGWQCKSVALVPGNLRREEWRVPLLILIIYPERKHPALSSQVRQECLTPNQLAFCFLKHSLKKKNYLLILKNTFTRTDLNLISSPCHGSRSKIIMFSVIFFLFKIAKSFFILFFKCLHEMQANPYWISPCEPHIQPPTSR